jgi:hypothetical protein
MHKYYDQAKLDINDTDDFAEENSIFLRFYVNGADEKTLKLELELLIKDCQFLAEFCYFQEGDGFLDVTTFNHFESVINDLKVVTHSTNAIAPYIFAVIAFFNLSAVELNALLLLQTTAKRAKNTLAKLLFDTFPTQRLGETMRIFQAARYWN